MHCPQCGLQQISGEIRFCRSCGFSLSGVKELVIPDEKAAKAERTRIRMAFNQGLALMLSARQGSNKFPSIYSIIITVIPYIHDFHLLNFILKNRILYFVFP